MLERPGEEYEAWLEQQREFVCECPPAIETRLIITESLFSRNFFDLVRLEFEEEVSGLRSLMKNRQESRIGLLLKN